MRTLSKLLHAADYFYNEAAKALRFSKYAQSAWTMPDDEDDEEEESSAPARTVGQSPLQNISDILPYIKDKNLAYDVGLVGELYKKALELNDGFAIVAHTINGILNEQEDLEPEVETALYDVLADIKAKNNGRIPTQVGPKALETLKQVHNAYEYGVAEDSEVPDAEEPYTPEPLPDEPEQAPGVGKVVFDPTGGVGREQAQTGTGRGYSLQDRHKYVDWAAIYNGRANRLEGALKSETNPIYRARLEAIIPKYRQMAQLIAEHNRLYAKTQPAPGAFPAEEARLKTVDEEIKKLRTRERKTQRFNTPLEQLSLHELQTLVDDIKYANTIKSAQEKLATIKDPRKRKLLEQIIKYNELMISLDINKDKEREARLALIRALEGKGLNRSFKFPKGIGKSYDERMAYLKESGLLDKPRVTRKAWWNEDNDDIDVEWDPRERSSISDEQIAKMENAIEEAAKLKKPIGVRNKERWQEEKQARETGSLRGLVRDFEKSIAFKKNDLKKPIKKAITLQVEKDKETLFKPYIDGINAANAAGNQEQAKKLIADLAKAMDMKISQLAEQDPKIQNYVAGAKRIYEFRDQCNVIEALPEFSKGVTSAVISDDSKDIIMSVVQFGIDTVTEYAQNPTYKGSIGWIDKIVQFLNKLVGTDE
jgi:hypothetical protein